MIQQMLFPPLRSGPTHVMGLGPIAPGRTAISDDKFEQGQSRPAKRRTNGGGRDRRNHRHVSYSPNAPERRVLIDNKPIAIQLDRTVAKAANPHLAFNSPRLGGRDEFKHHAEEALDAAGGTTCIAARAIDANSSEAVAVRRNIRTIAIQLTIDRRLVDPVLRKAKVSHLRSPLRLTGRFLPGRCALIDTVVLP